MPESEVSDLECLERFVSENDDLFTLEEKIGRFNVFDALGVARKEIRHSNFLAWLLDPGESHGQGDLFLKPVLMDIFRHARQEGQPVPVSPVILDGAEIRGVEIRREWRNIDLLIACKEPAIVIAIENKVDSGEHSGQLERYEEIVRREYASIKPMFVYLTPSGQDASKENWTPYAYSDLHRVLMRVRNQAAGSLGADVGVFFDHYLNLIGSRFMDDPQIQSLCRKIYANHKRAIELILEHAPVAGSEALAPIVEWLTQRPESWIVRSRSNGYLLFAFKPWLGRVCKGDGLPVPGSLCDIYVECQSWGTTETWVAARLIVGNSTDQQSRVKLISMLNGAPYELGMARKKPSEKWTRLEAKTLAKWTTEGDVPAEALVREFERWVERLMPALQKIPDLIDSIRTK